MLEKEFLTVENLCELLQVSRVTVYRWREQGMPYIKIGRNIRFEKEKVLEWIRKYQENSQN